MRLKAAQAVTLPFQLRLARPEAPHRAWPPGPAREVGVREILRISVGDDGMGIKPRRCGACV